MFPAEPDKTAFSRPEGLMGEVQSIPDELSLSAEKFEATTIKSKWGIKSSWKSVPNLYNPIPICFPSRID